MESTTLAPLGALNSARPNADVLSAAETVMNFLQNPANAGLRAVTGAAVQGVTTGALGAVQNGAANVFSEGKRVAMAAGGVICVAAAGTNVYVVLKKIEPESKLLRGILITEAVALLGIGGYAIYKAASSG